jgi:hypothetical protein
MTFQPPPATPGNDSPGALYRHAVELARALGLAMQGKTNNVLTFTCAPGTTSTVIEDPRLTIGAAVLFDPMTASAAAELAAGTIYAAEAGRNNRVWTVTHANSGATDRTFRVLVVG